MSCSVENQRLFEIATNLFPQSVGTTDHSTVEMGPSVEVPMVTEEKVVESTKKITEKGSSVGSITKFSREQPR